MNYREQAEHAYEQAEYDQPGALAAVDSLQPMAEGAGDAAAVLLCQITRLYARKYHKGEGVRALAQELVAAAEKLSDSRLQGQAHNILSLTYLIEGQTEVSLVHALIAARLARANGDTFTEAEVENRIGLTFQAKNDFPTAILHLQRVVVLVAARDDAMSQAITFYNLAHLYVLTEDWPAARPLLDAAQALIEPHLHDNSHLHWHRLYGRVCAGEAAVALGQGDLAEAEAWVARGEATNERDPAKRSVLVAARLGRVLAGVRLSQGRPAEATALLTPLIALLQTTATQEEAYDIERRLVYQVLAEAHRPRSGPD